jgi:hypothetical protein
MCEHASVGACPLRRLIHLLTAIFQGYNRSESAYS